MINWNEIDTVLLDMDGTLLDLHFDNYFWLTHLPERYAEMHNIPLVSAQQTLTSLIQSQEGSLNWYCVDYWTETLNIDISKLKEEVQHLIAFRPHAQPFLEYLKAQGKQRVLLTNAHPKSISIKLSITGLDHYVDQIISSHSLGYPKEDDRFWPLLSIDLLFDRNKTLFIDDSLKVLHAAKRYGIAHLLAILKPDSQSPERKNNDFVALDSFTQLHLP
jgi:putative hydrolase of the HAD superfamily